MEDGDGVKRGLIRGALELRASSFRSREGVMKLTFRRGLIREAMTAA
jgi:hypothetical protein